MTDYTTITRLAAGTLSAQTILNDSQYLVENFPRFSDEIPIVGWVGYMDSDLTDGQIVQSLQGIGGRVGKVSFPLIFASLSPLQAQYIYTDILQNRDINAVTVAVLHQRYGLTVYNGYLAQPTNFAQAGTVQTGTPIYSNIAYQFNRGVIAPNSNEYNYEYSDEYS